MDDVRTLAHHRRRQRQARQHVAMLATRRQMLSSAAAFAQLREAAIDATDHAQEAVAAFDVHVMWERACVAPL